MIVLTPLGKISLSTAISTALSSDNPGDYYSALGLYLKEVAFVRDPEAAKWLVRLYNHLPVAQKELKQEVRNLSFRSFDIEGFAQNLWELTWYSLGLSPQARKIWFETDSFFKGIALQVKYNPEECFENLVILGNLRKGLDY